MNKSHRKIYKRKPAVVIIIFAICILTFMKGVHVYAAATGNTATTTGNTATATDNQNGISGTLGPLEFHLDSGQDGKGLTSSLQMLLVLTVITLAPSILIMVTSFTRIIIVLHFVRSALGTQTTPPNQVLIGLALFLTLFIMSPVLTKINDDALKPLSAGTITQQQAWDAGIDPLRTFMLEQIKNPKDLRLFLDIAGISDVKTPKDIPITVVIPAFIISELRTAFIIGFLIYIPFLVIDMVVASTLMSMGMMMLPPTMISMPFKILLFIMADGWNLIIGGVVKTFYRS